ncbi:PepSY-associated TM helix domain-containing protein [Persicitalea jodogahamensis]|uniref:Membrane protein n=1 Tax=Persicitalea jodogahamensis TaxID=402147 RepID=A0A8J3D965_9BACT|nr:PepSY-associated TM helix domain-containing protein [Persicitalea jodogahamensis]GHB71079.1 membrane protein [Persicitalea jodogahamensis]
MAKTSDFDNLVYAIHKWCGLIAGLFILMLSITGAMLVFNDEIDTATNADMVKVNPEGQRLSTDALIQSLVQQLPDASLSSTLLYPGEPDRAPMTQLRLGDKNWWVYQNPATGAVLGKREPNETFMKVILHVHEHLTLGQTGHAILLVVGIALILMVVTGVWYYRKSLFSVFKIGVRNRNTYLVNSDLHKLTGVLSFIFLLLMAVTGSFMHWEKVERMFEPKEAPAAARAEEPQVEPAAPDYTQLSLVRGLQIAEKSISDFTPAQIRYPKAADGNVVIAGTRPESNRLLGVYTSSVEINPASGEVVKVEHAEDRDFEANAEAFMEQVHFGHYGGIVIQLFYALGGIGLGIMTITGFVIWWKKRNFPKQKAKAARMA